MVYIEAENRKTGKPKFFTETAWRNLQNSKIENPYVRVTAPSRTASKNLIAPKSVQVPKEVLDFKNKGAEADANADQAGATGASGPDDSNHGSGTEALRSPAAPAGPASKTSKEKGGK